MQVKHIGIDGRVRRIFDNVVSMWQHEGNSIVTVNRVAISAEVEKVSSTLPLRNFSCEFPIAIINLAPGQSIERVDDEPERS